MRWATESESETWAKVDAAVDALESSINVQHQCLFQPQLVKSPFAKAQTKSGTSLQVESSRTREAVGRPVDRGGQEARQGASRRFVETLRKRGSYRAPSGIQNEMLRWTLVLLQPGSYSQQPWTQSRVGGLCPDAVEFECNS